MREILAVGVDPAPAKSTVVVVGTCAQDARRVALTPLQLPAWVAGLERRGTRVLVAWDAPLTFNPEYGYSDRPIDKAVRKFIAEQVRVGTFEKGAISALPFSGCPHWAITCAALGLPFGGPSFDLPLEAAALEEPGAYLVEVHPAVAIGLWWLADGDGTLRRYKPGGATRAAAAARSLQALAPVLQERTGLGPAFFRDADTTDAAVAFSTALAFVQGEARWLGSPQDGGYVIPCSRYDAALSTHLREARASMRARMKKTAPQEPDSSGRAGA